MELWPTLVQMMGSKRHVRDPRTKRTQRPGRKANSHRANWIRAVNRAKENGPLTLKMPTQMVAIEAEYLAALKRQLSDLDRYYQANVLPAVQRVSDRIEAQRERDGFYDADDFGLEKTFADFRRHALLLHRRANKIARTYARRGEAFQREKWVHAIRGAVGINVSKMLGRETLQTVIPKIIADNTALIKSLTLQQVNDLTATLGKFSEDRSIKKTLVQMITSSGQDLVIRGINRAKLIARDQTQKFLNRLNQHRQEELGITYYFWRDSSDERVRPEHKDNDGKRFAWADPPSTGHPGEEIQCRCTAEPDLSGLLSLTA